MPLYRTTVVSIKKYPKYDVYIGREGHGFDGYFGNPVRTGEYCRGCRQVHSAPGSTLPCFKAYFLRRVQVDPVYRARVLDLFGKTLGCFCTPTRDGEGVPLCHGEIIVDWLEEQYPYEPEPSLFDVGQ